MLNSVCWFKRAQTSPYFRPERFKSSPNFRPKKGSNPYPLALRIPIQPDVSEQLTSTGSGLFSFFDGGFAQICG